MRWDEQRVENDLRLPGVGDGTVVRTFDAPEAMGINFHEVRARSALNHVPGGRYGFSWTINPFRGCTHACTFASPAARHTYLDFDAGRDFEREIVVKVNVPELLRAELARPSWKRELVALGTNTDPYQWVESRYRMMPEILEALEEAETPVSVLTKSPLVMRDVEIFERMAKGLPVSVNLSVPTLDEDAWRATEPHTPSPAARLDAVAELRRRGIDSGVLIAPLMPGINDDPDQVRPIVDRARKAGATFLGGVALHLRDEVKDVFFAWLEAKRPDLLPRYEQLYSGRAYMRPEQRKRATRAVSGWGRPAAPGEAAGQERSASGRSPGPCAQDARSCRRPRGTGTRPAPRRPPLLGPFVQLRRTRTPWALCRPESDGTAPRAVSARAPRGRSPTSITSSGRSATHSRSRPPVHRLGSAVPLSPVSSGASIVPHAAFRRHAEAGDVADRCAARSPS